MSEETTAVPDNICGCGHTREEHFLTTGPEGDPQPCGECECGDFEIAGPVCVCGHLLSEHCQVIENEVAPQPCETCDTCDDFDEAPKEEPAPDAEGEGDQ